MPVKFPRVQLLEQALEPVSPQQEIALELISV
jgi:hypothetical protein